MTRSELESRARDYIAAERNDAFRKEVDVLLSGGDRDFADLEDRFYTDLAFGTGGLRGIIGGGTNRMNSLVVRRATYGLGTYVKTHGESEKPKAVIAYDSRRYSDIFAEQAASTLCALGFTVYLFSSLRPTPELSFAVRHLGADVGIVVTASHNPPQYNGYKVYWNDGAQVVPPHDTGIIEAVRSAPTDVPEMTHEEAVAEGLLVEIDKEVDDAFVAMAKARSLRPELLQERGSEIRVVYTPLHGTGAMLVERLFRELGIKLRTVPVQRKPNGNFPTVEFPNPEEAAAMRIAIDYAVGEGADLVMGTDPDADRLGVAVRDGSRYRLITGNQLGVLLADYVFGGLKELGRLPKRAAFVNTIVTTELQSIVAASHGAECYETLTGFKWIAAKIREFESTPDGPTFIMGDEESYGYMLGSEVRDKDGITAALLTAELHVYHESRGSSLLKRLEEIYEEFGYFEERTVSAYFRGITGTEKMAAMMDDLRATPPRKLGGVDVVSVRDVKTGTTTTVADGSVAKDVDLPSSNVLQFFLADGSRVSARPSGTEPKIKFYMSVRGPAGGGADARKEVGALTDRLEAEIRERIEKAEG